MKKIERLIGEYRDYKEMKRFLGDMKKILKESDGVEMEIRGVNTSNGKEIVCGVRDLAICTTILETAIAKIKKELAGSELMLVNFLKEVKDV